jgi:cytochrome c oxidase cbb3-type subunit 2
LNTLGRAEQSSAGKPLNPDAETGMDPLMLMQITRLCAAPFIHPNQARIDSSAPDWSDLSQRRTQLVARGQTLYTQNCAGCHGASGDGNGAAAMGLMPKPSNLRQHQFSVQGLAHVLWNGRAGSAMPAWRDLPANDLASLAIYVQGLHTSDNDNTSSSVPLLVQGAVVYARNCVSCHGVQGDGHGLAAIAFLPRPADFTTVQPDTPRILQVLNQGIPGTSMVPWPGLVAADKQAVAAFVRTLYQAKPVSAR